MNLFNHHVDDITKILLEKGFNLAMVSHNILIEDILCGIEDVIEGTLEGFKDIFWWDCSIILQKEKPPSTNISKW